MKGLQDSFCNQTVYPYVYNLTSSYTDQKNEATMVTTTVAMFMLAMFFFNLNLFSHFSDVSAILNPSVRLLLSTALSLFLPVMTYLFSEAKNQGATMAASTSSSSYDQLGELSLRARVILMWMLLVELLRKKVEAVLVNVGMQWYSGTIDRFARIVWLGYLVFYNVKSPGKKAIYGTLWVLTASKFLQRVVVKEVLERSFTYGRNIHLLNSYMDQTIQEEQEEHVGSAELLMKNCKYTVMGEDNLERTAGRHGYQVTVKKEAVVTVGDIWTQAAAEPGDSLLRREHLRRLCLSFALYKLLRRRFEDIPIAREETRNCRNLIFMGVLKEEAEQGAEVALFQVFNDETQFICEYYHSVLPVVLSSPFFFLANYILFPILVWAFCLLTFISCGNGNVPYAYHSITSDNYIIYTGATTLARCLLRNITHSPQVLFASIDLGTTTLLILAFIYEEVMELLVFILSNWLIVSLLVKPHWRQRRILCRLIRGILWVRSMLSHPKLCFKQLSVLGFFQLSSPSAFMVPTKAVPKEVMKSIVDYLVAHLDVYGTDGTHSDPLNSAWSSTLQLEKHRPYRPLLLPVCKSTSIAEFILTCHIATGLMEVRYPQDEKEMGSSHSCKVATMLSKYCTYLVAFYPELLPDDKNGTEHVYKTMKKEMKELGGCWWYHLSLQGTRYKRLTEIGKSKQEAKTMVHKGAKFGTALIEKVEENNEARERVWELLADLWTELMVYVAPSAGNLHVKAHKEVLARGGEFITVLWVLCTHTGMTTPALAPWEVACRTFDEQP